LPYTISLLKSHKICCFSVPKYVVYFAKILIYTLSRFICVAWRDVTHSSRKCKEILVRIVSVSRALTTLKSEGEVTSLSGADKREVRDNREKC
jgi:hypothetical protein